MSDRLALPDDRRTPCLACGSEKREYLTECAACQKAICSTCAVMTIHCGLEDVELCRRCALDELNQHLEVLVPVCICEWPAWSHYGQQLAFPKEAA